MEGIDCVSLDVLRQYPENEPSDIKCFESGYLKRYCDLTLIDVIIWCKAFKHSFCYSNSWNNKRSDFKERKKFVLLLIDHTHNQHSNNYITK